MAKKQKIIISSTCDTNIEDAVKVEIESAMQKLAQECSEKYMRNIEVSMKIDVK